MKTQSRLPATLTHWFHRWTSIEALEQKRPLCADWLRYLPLTFVHLMCLGVLWVGWSRTAVFSAVAMYVLRMFAVTGFYHRYFAHRTFKTSRLGQFVFALLGTCAVQRGPLWWAAHHRHHHRHSDRETDIHSPLQQGFLWSHMGWITSRTNFAINLRAVSDLAKFPELRFLDRFDVPVAVMLGVLTYLLGASLAVLLPALGTNGLQMLVWGFFVSTVVLYHGTFTINSLAHQIGRRRYETSDTSGNSLLLAALTLGEGWHNNHHHYPASARQGFYWWEIDITYYLLVMLSWTGLIWDLRPVPEHVRSARRTNLAAAA